DSPARARWRTRWRARGTLRRRSARHRASARSDEARAFNTGQRPAYLHSGVSLMFVSHALLRRLIVPAMVLATTALPALAAAQTAAEHIAMGDRDHTVMNAPSALHHYEEAIKLEPTSYDALWKAAREAVDAGEYAPPAERDADYTLA